MIRVDKLAKSFHDKKRGTVHALEHVSFDVKSREIFGLLGPNGAGKTTCLRLSGHHSEAHRRDGGSGRRGHRPSPGSGPAPDRVSFGRYGILARLTPREVLSFFGKLNGMEGEKLRRRIDEMVETFEMGELRETPRPTSFPPA